MKTMQLVSFVELQAELEQPIVYKALTTAHRYLAELKGMAKTIPNQSILLSTLSLQEAQDSSAIENIITTQDALFKYRLNVGMTNLATKEVAAYADGLQIGYQQVQEHVILTPKYNF
jgi:Fic family protein